MKEELKSADEALAPDGFANRLNGDKNDHDGVGLHDKHATHAIRIPIKECEGVEDGYHAIPYAWFRSAAFLNFEHTLIAFSFEGELRNGESKTEGVFDIEIKGRDLERVYFPIAEARKTSVHPSTPPVKAGEPEVTSITVKLVR